MINQTKETRVNTKIQSISGAVIAQTVIRYAAFAFIAWLTLSFIDGWVMAWLAK